jgi:hypothetical protein
MSIQYKMVLRFIFQAGLCLFATGVSAQSNSAVTGRWVADLTILNVNSDNVVYESVPDGGKYYTHRNFVFPAVDVTYFRQRDIVGFGIGVSTNSVVQSLDLTYTLPKSFGDRDVQINENLYRHMAGLHGALVFRQQDVEFGIRLGVYATLIQNDCPQTIDQSVTLVSSANGIRRAEVLAECVQVEQTLSKALTRFHLVYRLSDRLHAGVFVTNWGWRRNRQRPFFRFAYSFDSEWGDGSSSPSERVDAVFTEPVWQVGVNLRYEFVR